MPKSTASTESALRTVLRLLCAVSVGGLVMGVFVASVLDHGKPERRPWCATEGCIYHAYRLADAMDPAADPCEDFYAYTCGHWEVRFFYRERLCEHDEVLGSMSTQC